MVLLGDAGAGKSSLVLRYVKEQFVEFQQSAGIPASDIDSGSMSKQGRLVAIHKNCSASASSVAARAVQIQTTPASTTSTTLALICTSTAPRDRTPCRPWNSTKL